MCVGRPGGLFHQWQAGGTLFFKAPGPPPLRFGEHRGSPVCTGLTAHCHSLNSPGDPRRWPEGRLRHREGKTPSLQGQSVRNWQGQDWVPGPPGGLLPTLRWSSMGQFFRESRGITQQLAGSEQCGVSPERSGGPVQRSQVCTTLRVHDPSRSASLGLSFLSCEMKDLAGLTFSSCLVLSIPAFPHDGGFPEKEALFQQAEHTWLPGPGAGGFKSKIRTR